MNPRGILTVERRYLIKLLEAANQQNAFAVVLLGSVARRVRTELWSDFDVLGVEVNPPKPRPGIHLVTMSREELSKRLTKGEDLVQWALRFGVPLLGRTRWHQLRNELLACAEWPNPKFKADHSLRRMEVSKALLEAGDTLAAQKEAIYAASHAARAFLLARRKFPLSRPELPSQLRLARNPVLAEALTQVSMVNASRETVEMCLQVIARELAGLCDETSSAHEANETPNVTGRG